MTALRYPSNFAAGPQTDYIELQFARRDYNDASTQKYSGGPVYLKESEPIILNVPQKVTEQMSQQFNNSTTGELGPFLRNGSGLGNSAALLKSVAQRFVENFALGKTVQVANKLGASQFTDNGILSATSGIVFNPNLEVLYEGPDFRSFNFQFTMFTKSAEDAKAIYAIVDTLRKGSLPSAKASSNTTNLGAIFSNSSLIQTGTAVTAGAGKAVSAILTGKIDFDSMIGGLAGSAGTAATGLAALGGAVFSGENRFIKQPPFILIKYKRGAGLHPFIQPLLPAAITNLSFDFTPTGNYTQLSNFDKTNQATTVGVVITMQVTEVTNLFSDVMFDNLPTVISKSIYGPAR